MKRLIFLIIMVAAMTFPVSAMDFTAPPVPESGQAHMPEEPESFGEGLWYVLKSAITQLQPSIAEAAGICLALIAIVLLMSIVTGFSGNAVQITQLVGALAIGLLLIRPTNSLIRLGTATVSEMSEYGKLLLPVMTATLAAQGSITASTALYTGTAFFSALLTNVIAKLAIPLLYVYICLSIASSAVGEEVLGKLRDLSKWIMTWTMKTILYVFTGYISITGVVSGTADASAIKATKLALSGAIPVVGSIISDASETILVSAGVMKSAAGVYGLLAILSVVISPFLQVGIQYLLLKLAAPVCGVFGTKRIASLIQDFSGAMGLILAMVGTVCLLLLIGTVCFMKGAA